MNCQEPDARLDDYLDGALSAAESAAAGAHLRSCALCREREGRLRQLLAHATALPRSVSPPRDLWPGIARRLERERRPWLGSVSPWALAAAATVVVGVAAALWTGGEPSRVRTVAMPPAGAEAVRVAGTAVADPVLAAAEQDFEAAATALLEALRRRSHDLEPETLAAVEGNIEVIDRALAEVRQALSENPASPELGRMLVATHRKKVDVLRRVVRLSTAL
jgi:predicted anti-sigma-YlaC factor YlaD